MTSWPKLGPPSVEADVPPMLDTSASTFGFSLIDLGNLVLILHHLVERSALRRFGHRCNLIGVLVGDEAFWDLDEQLTGRRQHHQKEHHRHRTVAQHPLQAAVVHAQHALEELLRDARTRTCFW